MTNLKEIEVALRKQVSSQISLHPEAQGRFRLLTPFTFPDGDNLVMFVARENGHWVITDLGHTFMHLSYEVDEKELQRGTRQKIITNVLSAFDLKDRQGEIVSIVKEEDFASAVTSMVQGLLQITDVRYLSRERVRSTFLDDFRAFIEENVPENRRTFDWHDAKLDPEAIYPVDCKINGMPIPLMVFALNNDEKVNVATITLLQFERWGLKSNPVGIFQDLVEIGRKPQARFTDVCGKQFSSLSGNKERITKFLAEAIGK